MQTTIVIPTYNGAQFIGAALQSISWQIYRDFHVVISDDGSTDRTLTIVKEFQKTSGLSVHVLEHDRLGLVENWNYLITFVQRNLPETKYIKFLLQDDILTPNCLSSMVAMAEANPHLGMVFSRRFLIGEVDQSLQWLHHLSAHWSDLQTLNPALSYFQNGNFRYPPDNKIGEPTNVLIPKLVFDRLGLFDCQFRQYCDLEMWLRIMANFDVGYIDRDLAGFRIHPHQTTWQNHQQDRVWAEIYALWRKVLVDGCYHQLPGTVKKQIFAYVCRELLRECFRIGKHRRIDRLPTVLYWFWQFIHARFIPTS